jgi:thioredoxin-related protein
MKRVLILLLVVLSVSPAILAGEKNKKKKKAKETGIKWMTWDQAQVQMKKQPKKVWVDVYTDWCGWCKVMDKKTFSDPQVIKFMNDNFYAIKFNSEKDDSIKLLDKLYVIKPENRVNDLAVELLRGQLSYPTNVFLEENFQNPIPIPGYQAVPQIEMVMRYLGENHYKTVKWEDYQKTFVGTWKEQAPPPAPASN